MSGFNIAKYQVYIYILIAIVIAVILYKFSNNLMILFGLKKSKDETKATTDTLNQLDRDIKTLQNQGQKLSYQLSMYKQWADGLESAMKDLGTDTDYIYSVAEKMKNQIDLSQLLKEFGRRPYYFFGLKQGDWSLSQWINNEMSSRERNKVNDILAKNGIQPLL
jgi:conjugal transfer/entry exclusion protein